tara:strand:+ start:863 stop:1699 length:837 start_codon:yes stop_codon:yes gene_type:complete
MPYLGRSSQKAIRQRFIFTQSSAGATSISGADDSNATLRFDDGEYVDVILNGITLAKTEYNTLTANTISGLAALSSGDVLQVTVYDMFNVADSVSASTGGTFTGGITATGGVNVGTIKDAGNNATAMTIDSDGVVKIPQIPCFFISGSNAAYVNTSPIPFGATAIDTRSGVDLSNNKYVVPVAGKFHFHLQLGIVSVTGTGYIYPQIRRTTSGGTATNFGYSYYNPANSSSVQSYSHLDVNAFIDCAVGDSIDAIVFQSNGTYYNGTAECRFLGNFLG